MIRALRISGFLLTAALVFSGCGTTPAVPTEPTDPTDPAIPAPSGCFYEGETLANLEVAAGQTCTLSDTVVQGDVTLASGASLATEVGGEVKGNVRGQGAAGVTLDGLAIGGNVELTGGDTVDLTDASVEGRVQLIGNLGLIGVSDTYVGKDLEVSQNTGGVFVDYNVVEGNLQCEQNDPAPTGADNVVSGNKVGQCSEF